MNLPKYFYENMAAYLAEHMKRAKVTPEQLAAATLIYSVEDVHSWLRGDTRPSSQVWEKIAPILDIRPLGFIDSLCLDLKIER